jgi:hypothetical protein
MEVKYSKFDFRTYWEVVKCNGLANQEEYEYLRREEFGPEEFWKPNKRGVCLLLWK